MQITTKFAVIVAAWASVLCGSLPDVSACSSVFITSDQGEKPAVVGRTLDFEDNEGKTMGVGLIGDKNVSDVNMQDGVTERAEWTNTYDYIGKVINASNAFIDGVNTGGVYVAGLQLPGLARFADYDPNGKAALSNVDFIGYLLGTSGTVEEALRNLGKVQVVLGATIAFGNTYGSAALHYVVRDKTGKSAVMEFVEGGVRIYLDKLLTYDLDIPALEAATNGKVDQSYAHAGKVLTNAPDYAWQNQCFEKQNSYFEWTGSRTDRTWDGGHQNGSGLYGLRGDSTAPSRFQRPMSLIANGLMPTPSTTAQAKFLAQGAIASLIQPAGVSVCPTIWVSITDLNSGEYLYRLICLLGTSTEPNETVIVIPNDPADFRFQEFNANDVRTYLAEQRPNVKHIVESFQGLVPENQRAAVISGFEVPTAGATPLTVVFEN